jgi:hypothetical protein
MHPSREQQSGMCAATALGSLFCESPPLLLCVLLVLCHPSEARVQQYVCSPGIECYT